jgi:CubicO group peptidase (beta-lactamase class C family)
MSKWLLGSVVTVSVAAGSVAALTAQYDYHRTAAEIVWRGTQALKLCNGLFVSNRTVDHIYAQELAGLGEPMPRTRVEIDVHRKTVAIGIGTGDSVPPMRAALRQGVGCVVMAPDQTFADIGTLPLLDMPPLAGDAATLPWPEGDRLDSKRIPSGVDDAALKRAGDWTFDRVAHGGHQGQVTLSLLVIHGGDIVYERYASGVNMHTRTRTWSTAKSITSTLVGMAADQGLLKLDEPLPFKWHPAGGETAPDPRRKITLRHALHMSSGLYPVDNDLGHVTGSALSYWAGANSADGARDRGLIREPGTIWDYENYDTLLAVLALRTALGDEKTYKEFPRRALFDRIGMRNTMAGMDRFGHYVLSSQVYTNARDLGRLGLLYLNRGKWKGEQLLSESWVYFVRTPAPATRDRGREYGGHFWLVPDSRADLPQDAYSTNGARGQYTVIVPSYDLVVVRRGLDFRTGGRGLSQWDLLAEIVKAFPGRKGGAKLPISTS